MVFVFVKVDIDGSVTCNKRCSADAISRLISGPQEMALVELKGEWSNRLTFRVIGIIVKVYENRA